MIVPRYWAEGRAQYRKKDRQVTVRRFGWSNDSSEDAQAMADARAAEALQEILSGKKLQRREPRVPYNGAAGVPIREEIVGEFGDTIITRNAYGALCLNTPSVLFGDIDFSSLTVADIEGCLRWSVIPIGIGAGLATGSWVVGLGAVALGVILSLLGSFIFDRWIRQPRSRLREKLRIRVHRFIEQHPNWNIRVYETPAGMRLLVTHRLFSPSEAEASAFFKAFHVDPVYRRMCERQNCFRARVSPKPWRVGMDEHLRPRPGTWPIKPEHLPRRQAWVDEYQQRAKDFASCRFIETVGTGVVHPDVAPVLQAHDELCQCSSDLPIA